MSVHIDQSVYPELSDPPRSLDTIEERADYVHRICTAWDHGIHPEPQTFELFAGWKDVFDSHPVATSTGYHAFRAWFGWENVPVPEGLSVPIPVYVRLDEAEERPPDPCVNLV